MKPALKAMRDEALVGRVREALSEVPGVKEKRMSGSVAFMVSGKMFVTARAARIMCRIDPALHETAIVHRGAQTVVMRGRPYRGYVYVSAEALGSNRELKYWISLALAHNKTHAKRPNQAPDPTAPSGRGSS